MEVNPRPTSRSNHCDVGRFRSLPPSPKYVTIPEPEVAVTMPLDVTDRIPIEADVIVANPNTTASVA